MVLPLRTGEGGRAVVGATRPDDVFQMDEVRRRLGVASVKVVVVTAYDIRGAWEIAGLTQPQHDVDVGAILADVNEGDVAVEKDVVSTSTEHDLEQQAGDGPVIRYVNYIIQTAVQQNASDIHIEPAEKRLKV